MKISVITPSLNSGDRIERAIQSVLLQDYTNWEHIIVDGGSTDNTFDMIDKYPHIEWIIDRDNGQPDAMNKGFRFSTGDLIVYLNADDYFHEGAFSAVITAFKDDTVMLMGNIFVKVENNNTVWINNPRTDLESMIRHWEGNAFCVNPVGYFYRRELQEDIPFNNNNDDKMDLEFLLEVASRYKINKIDTVLGTMSYNKDSKTFKRMLNPDYWREDNFPFIGRFVKQMDIESRTKYLTIRECGYQARRKISIRDIFKQGNQDEFYNAGKFIPIPQDEQEIDRHSLVVENNNILTDGDSIVILLPLDKLNSCALQNSIRQTFNNFIYYPLFCIENLSDKSINDPIPEVRTAKSLDSFINRILSLTLKQTIQRYGRRLTWKFICGIVDPIGLFILYHLIGNPAGQLTKLNFIDQTSSFSTAIDHYFQVLIREFTGINVFDETFNKKRGYEIFKKDNRELLVYKAEALEEIWRPAMLEYLGIPNCHLDNKSTQPGNEIAVKYHKLCEEIRLPTEFLDQIYSSSTVNFFFSESEITHFREKWRNY